MPSSTIKIFIFAAVIGIFGFLFYSQRNIGQSFQTISGKIDNFTALNIDGGKTSYQKEKGKATLIVLSASWCPACMSEIPMLKNLYREFEGTDFRILMVNEDENLKVAARFKKKYELPWTMIHWNYDLMNILGNPGVLPVSYLVDEQDSIVQIHTGIFDEKELTKSIRKILK